MKVASVRPSNILPTPVEKRNRVPHTDNCNDQSLVQKSFSVLVCFKLAESSSKISQVYKNRPLAVKKLSLSYMSIFEPLLVVVIGTLLLVLVFPPVFGFFMHRKEQVGPIRPKHDINQRYIHSPILFLDSSKEIFNRLKLLFILSIISK